MTSKYLVITPISKGSPRGLLRAKSGRSLGRDFSEVYLLNGSASLVLCLLLWRTGVRKVMLVLEMRDMLMRIGSMFFLDFALFVPSAFGVIGIK